VGSSSSSPYQRLLPMARRSVKASMRSWTRPLFPFKIPGRPEKAKKKLIPCDFSNYKKKLI
jgi:hypothetical protein